MTITSVKGVDTATLLPPLAQKLASFVLVACLLLSAYANTYAQELTIETVYSSSSPTAGDTVAWRISSEDLITANIIDITIAYSGIQISGSAAELLPEQSWFTENTCIKTISIDTLNKLISIHLEADDERSGSSFLIGGDDIIVRIEDLQGKNLENHFSINSISLQTKQAANKQTVQVYPNPTQADIYIGGVENQSLHQIQVLDLQGGQVPFTILQTQPLQLNVKPQTPGMYILKLQQDDGKVTYKHFQLY